MPILGPRSRKNLAQCHPDIVRVIERAIENGPDFVVICGHRNEEDQNAAFASGRSKLNWPKSKHNATPSRAVDVVPYPLDWKDLASFARVTGYILGISDGLGVPMRSGADWDRDWDTSDERFIDWPHLELV